MKTEEYGSQISTDLRITDLKFGLKKKILIFIDWYLPGYKAGGPIRSVANLVDHLCHEFEFSIITRDTDYCETTPYANVKSNEWNTLPNGVKVYYISEDDLSRSTISDLLRKTEFDVVYLNGIFSLYFTLIPLFLLRKKKNRPVVIAGRGMFAESALKVKGRKKGLFLKAVKILKLFDKAMFHATDQNEELNIRKVMGEDVKVKIAHNLPAKEMAAGSPERVKEAGSLKLVSIARIAPEKNLLYALRVLSSVQSNVVFDIYGPIYDQEYWEECQRVIADVPKNISIQYKNSLSSDQVTETFANYHFLFMPTRGENFGHIILQSLTSGCPVIISDQTPWKGLEKKGGGWDLPLERQEVFADVINACEKMDQEAYDRLSDSAFENALKYYRNEDILKQNRELFIL